MQIGYMGEWPYLAATQDLPEISRDVFEWRVSV